MTAKNTGKITRIIGAVIDSCFEELFCITPSSALREEAIAWRL